MTPKEMSQRAPRWWSQTDLGLDFNIAPCYGLGKVTFLSPSGLLWEGGTKMKKKKKFIWRPLLQELLAQLHGPQNKGLSKTRGTSFCPQGDNQPR